MNEFCVKQFMMNRFQTFLIIMAMLVSSWAFAQEKPEPALADPSKQVKVYPIPAIEFLTVRFETPQAKTSNIALRNIIGNELEVESELIDDYEVRFKVKDLPTGFYLLTIKNEATGLRSAHKFLKK